MLTVLRLKKKEKEGEKRITRIAKLKKKKEVSYLENTVSSF